MMARMKCCQSVCTECKEGVDGMGWREGYQLHRELV